MKYSKIDSNLFIKNRKNFVNKLESNSVAFFNSNDIYPISADSVLPFEQHRDIFYLCGVDQEESILILNPNANDPAHKEILFLKETSDHIAIWEGAKLNKDQAKSSTGIQSVYWLDEFETIFSKLMTNVDKVYFNNNDHYRKAVEMQTREDRFLIWLKSNYPEHKIEYSFPIMEKLRGVKEPEEIELIQKACDITEKGFRRVLKFLKPGVMEFHVEAEYSHEFLRNRSKGFAYTPIIASGYNACILHYINNNMQCKEGDMLLMDVGAEYANYSSDMTRTIPVNGRFTDRQKSVYQAVLNVKNEASKMLIPGTLWEEYHVEVGKLMTSELISLGLLDKSDIQNQDHKNPAYKKYFMHGTSHHMGLDTHDYGDLKTPMVANMVFTVEPGIYIPDENLGIRLEDDVVIKSSGTPINLMKSIPIEIEEIEEIMNS